MQQPPEVLHPLLSSLMEEGHEEAAAMVIDAILVSTPKDTQLIRLRAELELAYDPQRALRTLSKYFQLGGGDASDLLLYGRLLFTENQDAKAATAVLSHARAICEPSEKRSLSTLHAVRLS